MLMLMLIILRPKTPRFLSFEQLGEKSTELDNFRYTTSSVISFSPWLNQLLPELLHSAVTLKALSMKVTYFTVLER